jgi:putative flippase GtrA
VTGLKDTIVSTRTDSLRVFRFLVTGGVAAADNVGCRFVFSHWISYSAAIVLAWVVGVCSGFLLTWLFVFPGSRHSAVKSATIFVIVNLFALLQTWVATLTFAYYLLPALGIDWHAHDIAHLVGVGIPVFTSYFAHKTWSFR